MNETSLRRLRDVCTDYRSDHVAKPREPAWTQEPWANDPNDVILQKLGGFGLFRRNYDLLNYFRGRWEQQFGTRYPMDGERARNKEQQIMDRFIAARGMENACRIVKALFEPSRATRGARVVR